MVIKACGHPLEGDRFVTEQRTPRLNVTLADKHLKLIQHLAPRFSRQPPPDSTTALIIDAFRLYAQAMDERFDHASFLGLWQLAETLTLSDMAGGRTETVCRRLAWHGTRLKLPGSGFRHLLEYYAERRNDMVHHGIRDVGDDEVNFVKLICELVLGWLINESRHLRTKHHLAAFYQLMTSGDTVIEGFRGAANYIARSRKS